MSIKDLWFILKKKDPRANKQFNEDDQRKSIEVRQAMHEIKMRRLDAERARADYELAKYEKKIKEEIGEDYEDDDGEDMLLSSLQTILSARNPNNTQTAEGFSAPPTAFPSVVHNDISDDDIKAFIKSQPKMYVKMAKKAPKSMVIQQAMGKMGLTETQALRAYDILQQEF